jgi:hypothetical protein
MIRNGLAVKLVVGSGQACQIDEHAQSIRNRSLQVVVGNIQVILKFLTNPSRSAMDPLIKLA